MKNILYILSLFCGTFVLSNSTHAVEPLKIAVWSGSEKFEPIISLVYENLKIPIKFIPLPTERSITEVNRGSVDADIARSTVVASMYPNVIASQQSFLNFSLVGYVRADSPIKLEKIEDIRNHSAGLIIGTKIAEALVNKYGLASTKVHSPVQLAQLINDRRFEIALIATIQDYAYLEKNGLKRIPLTLFKTQMVHIFNKKHKKLQEEFDRELKRLKKSDPKFQELLNGLAVK
ncbi:MAG TPA: transporter substrate-binding domain-containing protein [Pseudobdellovibrionaceae bacterium]|nr:transporter substrate-binding domain-containing protein [Pseudobdellovibrionaceae bacterium]